ncbi:hypothetical protein BSK59_15640 [Paenibacillus odorifer]|uniref:hypothetical protein n=1 Tax=Paenibacillus odorifer TaxID=189426 RepID=UPI00096E7505|nr:hypothetical protein [Paenibacillus odorifer]OME54012.1 hypothetical protein BSK59_15640 [Paenibacillus odorifer]
MTKEQERNEKISNEIRDFLVKHELGLNVSIYFNGKAYRFRTETEYYVIEDIKGSEFFEYANDETVSMTFEGSFYYVVNGYADASKSLMKKFNTILEKSSMYYEQGHAWNLSLHEN